MKKNRDDGKSLHDKKFLDLPEYPGGIEAMRTFIRTHLKYPEEALNKKIEGVVHVQYWVDGQGKVSEAVVSHGIGYGCDEEALRIVRLLKYGTTKNRGMRIKASMKTRIEFRLPAQPSIEFSYKSESKKEEAKKTPTKPVVTYTYSISLNTEGDLKKE